MSHRLQRAESDDWIPLRVLCVKYFFSENGIQADSLPSAVSLPKSDYDSLANLNTTQLNAEFQRLSLRYKKDSAALRNDPQNSSLKEQVSTTLQRLRNLKDWTTKLNTDDGKRLAAQAQEKRKKEIDQRKSEIDEVIKSMKGLAATDICFLVDCTGSMSAYINAVRTQITQLVDTITAMFDARIRLAFIGYRDIDEELNLLDFTDNTESFKTFLGGVQATGGGDTCEDIFSGLETVAKLNWTNPNRILIHICDAPCHGTVYHDFKDARDDNYLEGDPKNRTAATLLLSIKELKITYCSIQLTPATNKMFTAFVSIYGPIHEINISNPTALMREISKETTSIIMSGISSTMSTFRINSNLVKNYTILSNEPNSVPMTTADVEITTIISPIDLADIFRPLLTLKSTGRMKIALNPFAKGSIRYAFHGQLFKNNISSGEMVYKEFISAHPGTNTLEVYREQLEMQIIAHFLAETFNGTMQKHLTAPKLIHYLDPHLVQQKSGLKKIYQVERRLKGQWQKWNNNSGYVSLQNFSSVLQAFSHWTYQITNNRMMVVDLQGVQIEGTFFLTDPAIHCDDLSRFQQTRTNLGIKGIREFFRTHVCSSICSQLNLKTPELENLSLETHTKRKRALQSFLPGIQEEDAPTRTTLPFTPGKP